MTKPRGWGLKPVMQRHFDALTQIGFADFEKLLADHYRDQGYVVEHCGTGRSGSRFDGGVDLKLRRESAFILVQCKHWNAKQVTHNAVHELLGIMVNEGATGAIVVTSGEFTSAAKQAGAKQGHVQLVDGIEVRQMLGDRLASLAPAHATSTGDSTPRQEDPWIPEQVESRRQETRPRRGRKSESLDEVLIKIVAGLILTLLVVFALPSMISRALQSATPKPTPQVSQPAAQLRASPQSESASPVPDSMANQFAPPQLTAQQLAVARAEQARQDAETQRCLERVPEVTHYRYSPLDQNRDPAPEQREATNP